MKVLRIRDKANIDQLLIKRGNNLIIPVIDEDGNRIIGLEVLRDPAYADLVEDILDLCEIIDHKPAVDPEPPRNETPPGRNGDTFQRLLVQHNNDLVAATTAYYRGDVPTDTKPDDRNVFARMWDSVVEFFS